MYKEVAGMRKQTFSVIYGILASGAREGGDLAQYLGTLSREATFSRISRMFMVCM